MSPRAARMVVGCFNPLLDRKESNDMCRLTRREVEIISMLQRRVPYKTVAERLFISVDAVKFHIRNIYGKLRIHNRTELINKYKWPV